MADREPVPWRTIFAWVGTVAATYLLFLLVQATARIIAWVVVAAFFAVILSPAVDLLQRKARIPRATATSIVFALVLVAVSLLLYAFIRPVVDQTNKFVRDLPGYVDDAQHGKGTIGRFVKAHNLEKVVRENRDRIQENLRKAANPALDAARGLFSTIIASLTISVLTFLLVLRGPQLTMNVLELVPERHRRRVRAVAADSAKAVSGYMIGNLLISVVAGSATYVMLRIMGVPYPEVLALFVAFTDLIPLIGATLGAIPTIGLAFLHSVPAGVVMLIFYIVYQQFENHILQVTVMSRTVQVNPLTVLISVLVGVELVGFLGALLAIPAAGILQVIARDIYDDRQGRLKAEPTVGAGEAPVSAES
jgi:predicted PurR-regulated permease PerM